MIAHKVIYIYTKPAVFELGGIYRLLQRTGSLSSSAMYLTSVTNQQIR